MTVTDPNYTIQQLADGVEYSEVTGNHPNPEQFVLSEIQRISNELKAGFQADDAAIVAYFNAQLTQINGLISALAGGTELQAAVELLNNIKNIVDADGNGILDALGPLNATIQGIQTTVTSLQTTQQAQQGEINGLNSSISALQTTVSGIPNELTNLDESIGRNSVGLRNLADNVSMNLQGLRDALQNVDVAWTPIVLPAPVFATTNVTGGGESGDPSAV